MRGLFRYKILKSLGAGAAGGVFLAEDRFLGGPPVALKRLHANADELLRASFEHEFGVLAALAVPGVARVIDFGAIEADGDDPGGPFFTRAYVDGAPLAERLATVPLETRLGLMSMIAKRVAPLHRAGVVHGDLKPQNVIVDAHGTPTLIDFGLARLPRETQNESVGASGTPPFMAPELFRGERASVRSDVYALGAMLWMAVTGKAPFEELGARALAIKASGRMPEKPAGLTGTPSRALDIALRALHSDPEKRLPAATEFAHALDALLPAEAGTQLPGVFVPPRPRGHERVLGKLDAWITGRSSFQSESVEPIALVLGDSGAGRSTLLRELKWRVQVRGVRTLEVSVRTSAGLGPLEALVHQALVLTDDELSRRVAEKVLDSIEKGAAVEEGTLTDALLRLLSAIARRGPVLVLVDDLDLAEDSLASALRLATHGEGGESISVVASAASAQAPSLRTLGTYLRVDVPPLALVDVVGLCESCLGAVDASVCAALATRSGGNAKHLMQLLSALADKGAVTVADVEAVAPSDEAARSAMLRVAAVGDARQLVELLAVAEVALPLSLVLAFIEHGGESREFAASALGRAVNAGVASQAQGRVHLTESLVSRVVRDSISEPQRRATADALLALPDAKRLPATLRARLLLVAGRAQDSLDVVRAAVRDHETQGAFHVASELLEALLPTVAAADMRSFALDAARIRHACGDYDAAAERAELVLADGGASAHERAQAATLMGRAEIAAGKFEAALVSLSRVPADAAPQMRAQVARERAKAHLRRGEYAQVLSAAEEGLALAANDDVVRVELLTSAGMVASYAGEHEKARARYNEAIDLARRVGSRRDEANAITYLAIDYHRASEFAAARELYAQSLGIARELGDVGSMATYELNLGAASYDLAEPARAASHYEAAAKLAKRAGRVSTDVSARANLANLHVYLGLYERALSEIEQTLRDAESAGMRATAAQVILVDASRLSRTGDVDGALHQCDDAAQRYRSLSHWREVTEALLDGAEILLDRDGPMDPSAAAARLASARTLCEENGIDPLRMRLRLLLARARGATADTEGAVGELEEILKEVRTKKDKELEWQTLVAAGKVHAARGADFLSRRHDQMAVEVLEGIATALPTDLRGAFWHDPRRRDVRKRAAQAGEQSSEGAMLEKRERPGDSQRASRLLEITKRLARERQIDRLLERITDAAVDLSGAERGFVLLTDEAGNLAPRTVRQAESDDAAHVAFSRSIAEAVLIDGEPIVTIDARDDRRLTEYMSVHKLMLRSVACLPIRGQSGVVGVLYLEHRRRTGRFHEEDMELLEAFADQAAIALENARLLEENALRQKELEEANAKLAAAKDEIERLLVARTEELHEAKAELDRTRHDSLRSNARFGIVGRSPAMRRVFELIDRVREASVPVVIHGESGTGKELAARAIHTTSSRSSGPFVALNCAAIPDALLESELFGHVKGAFTGAEKARRGVVSQASGGTLFLDEVGDMPAKMQIDLLRVLSDRRVRPVGSEVEESVDIRVVAASNKSLEKLVAEGKFREDLFYRLNVVELKLPPLRDRGEDLPLLCEYFLTKFAKQNGTPQKKLTRRALDRLAGMRLPGNVRQLEHLLLNACVLVVGDTIDVADLPTDIGDVQAREHDVPDAHEKSAAVLEDVRAREPAPANVDAFKDKERGRILHALETAGWNRARAAEALGMPRRTFYRRLQEYGIL